MDDPLFLFPKFDDEIQKEEDLVNAIDQCVEDGFMRISMAFETMAVEISEKLGLVMEHVEADKQELLMAAYLEGVFSYHQVLKNLEPEAAKRMESWMDLYITIQTDKELGDIEPDEEDNE